MKRLGLAALLLGAPGVAAAQVSPALQNGPVLGAAPAAAPAEVVTNIDPDSAPERSLGTNVGRSGNVYTIDGGRLSGTNLFHSFARFDLASGDVARWVHSAGDPAGITNVVNRVTGGDPSHLFGTIDSTALPNANFFFINPAGIVFGADAQVNVPAAAHFSTASELRFASGPTFAVTTPGGSTLSVAAPAAFGFLGQEGAILVSGLVPNSLPNQNPLSLTASSIAIVDTYLLTSGVMLAATGGGTAEVPLDARNAGALSGDIRLTRSTLAATPIGSATGDVWLIGGAVSMADSHIEAYSNTTRNSGSIGVLARSFDMDFSQLVTTGEQGGSAGDIGVSADTISIRNHSLLGSRAVEAGAPGSIGLVGGDIHLGSQSRIVSETFGSGDAGLVILQGERSVTLTDFAWISTDSVGSGESGGVLVATPLLRLTDSYISADSLGEGNAGGIIVQAGEAELVRSYLTSDSRGEGSGGVVHLTVDRRLAMTESYLTSTAWFTGDAGGIFVDAADLDLFASRMESNANGDGDAGLIRLHVANNLTFAEGSFVSSNSAGAGNAGGVEIAARNVDILWGSHISSDARGDGRGGEIRIAATDRLLLERAFISTDAAGAGDAGDLRIRAGAIEMHHGSFISSDTQFGSTGNAGLMIVQAGSLFMTTFSSISSEARGNGHGGLVLVDVEGRLTMENRASISSTSYGAGSAGVVSIAAASGLIIDSWILSDALSTGDAGGVGLQMDELRLVSSRITSEALGGGRGGTIGIIVTGDAVFDASTVATNTESSGNAGDILVQAGRLSLVQGSRIASAALPGATGFSGNVRLIGAEVTISEGSTVSTGSANREMAGGIVVEAGRLIVQGEGTAVTSENSSQEGGFAGTIVLQTGDAHVADGARISTNSLAGPAGNIFFDMRPGSFLRLTGAGTPGILETSSGPGTGGLIIIASPFAIITHGGSILALGQSGGANVIISTNYFIPSADRLNRVEVDGELTFENAIYDVSSGTVTADLSPIDASGILRGQCPAVRSSGQLSQLSIRAAGPYGTAPAPAPAEAGAAPPPESCR